MFKNLLLAATLSVSALANAPIQAQEISPSDAYAEAYVAATGEVFVPQSRGPTTKGVFTTDMWDIFVDAWEPYAGNSRAYPDQLHQSDVWHLLGIPDAYFINRSDMYVLAHEYLIVYYDDFGYSQVVLWVPNTTYQ